MKAAIIILIGIFLNLITFTFLLREVRNDGEDVLVFIMAAFLGWCPYLLFAITVYTVVQDKIKNWRKR